MSRYVIIYDKTDGRIIVGHGLGTRDVALGSGMCEVVINNRLVLPDFDNIDPENIQPPEFVDEPDEIKGLDLQGNLPENVHWLRLDGKHKMWIKEWVDDTRVITAHSIPHRFAPERFGEQVPYELMAEGEALKPNATKLGQILSEFKKTEGSNIGIIPIKLTKRVQWADFYVDQSDGNKLKRRQTPEGLEYE